MTQPRRLLVVFALLLALAGAGCALLQNLGLYDGEVPFSHARHGASEDLACLDCHKKAATEDLASMPKMAQCMTCHEGIDEKKPEERRLAALYGPKPQWTKVKAMPADLVFSHKRHVTENKIDCSACHNVASENVAERAQVDMVGTCMACHARQPLEGVKDEDGKRVTRASLVANDCAVCHREIRKDRPPSSHEFTTDRPPRSHQRIWREVHGQVARDSRLSKDRCALCHTQDFCSKCHQQEAPPSHTGFWRERGHGVAVDMNRSSCAVCHRSDFCDRCHRETAPRTHVGAWGAPRDSHCYSCHGLARGTGCGMCHYNTPSHTAAPAKPAWHNAGMNCRSCHVPVPHADNGMNCNTCHR
jgi:hypothetical protein